MDRITFWIIILGLLFSVTLTPKTFASSNRLGYQALYFSYDEPKMQETGVLHGVHAKFSRSLKPGIDILLEGEILGGGLDYDGQTLDGDPVTTDSKDQLFSFEIRSRFTDFRERDIHPEVGLGYRFWSNELQDNAGVSGFLRETSYLYVPLEVFVPLRSGPRWTRSFRTGYRYFVEGKVTSHLSDVQSCYPNVTNTQGSGQGWITSYTLQHYPRYGRDFSFTFFFKGWDVDSSDRVQTNHDISSSGCNDGSDRVFEPKNETMMVGTVFEVYF